MFPEHDDVTVTEVTLEAVADSVWLPTVNCVEVIVKCQLETLLLRVKFSAKVAV
jgi:hypothetical protein